MLSSSSQKLLKNHSYTSKKYRNNVSRRNLVVKASKSPQEIKELLKKEIAKANDVCCDMTKSDLDCMLQWDTIDDLSHAYRSALEDEKRKQEELNEKMDKEYLWNTRKKMFDI